MESMVLSNTKLPHNKPVKLNSTNIGRFQDVVSLIGLVNSTGLAIDTLYPLMDSDLKEMCLNYIKPLSYKLLREYQAFEVKE